VKPWQQMPIFRDADWRTLKKFTHQRNTRPDDLRPHLKLQTLVTIRPLQIMLKLSGYSSFVHLLVKLLNKTPVNYIDRRCLCVNGSASERTPIT
jgi:hypothetical protein